MGVELRVSAEIGTTENTHPGEQGIMMRTAQITTLVSESENLIDILDLAKARLSTVIADVERDIQEQIDLTKGQNQ